MCAARYESCRCEGQRLGIGFSGPPAVEPNVDGVFPHVQPVAIELEGNLLPRSGELVLETDPLQFAAGAEVDFQVVDPDVGHVVLE